MIGGYVANGKFIGVGVGPGDPELITIKALRILRDCPVIAAPRTRSGEMLALDIAQDALDLSAKEILPIDFTMERDAAKRAESYRAAADAIAQRLDAGCNVAMVNLGDVSIFATVCYVIDELDSRGYETEMVPGVTSFSAIGSRLGISLTEMNKPLHIIPASAKGLDEALGLPGSLVMMKSASQLDEVIAELESRGMLHRAKLVANCGLPDEHVIEDLVAGAELAKSAGYFTTIVITGD